MTPEFLEQLGRLQNAYRIEIAMPDATLVITARRVMWTPNDTLKKNLDELPYHLQVVFIGNSALKNAIDAYLKNK